jgi:hypothetical protein
MCPHCALLAPPLTTTTICPGDRHVHHLAPLGPPRAASPSLVSRSANFELAAHSGLGHGSGSGLISVCPRIVIIWSTPMTSSIRVSTRCGRSSTRPPPRCCNVLAASASTRTDAESAKLSPAASIVRCSVPPDSWAVTSLSHRIGGSLTSFEVTGSARSDQAVGDTGRHRQHSRSRDSVNESCQVRVPGRQ